MKPMHVRLENGDMALCIVKERMGFNHDVGAQAAWVEFGGKEFLAVKNGGTWRKWGAADRARPIVEHLERMRRERPAP